MRSDFLSLLDFFPVRPDLVYIFDFGFAKNVRMPANQFIHEMPRDLFEIKRAAFARKLAVKNHLQQQIAQFLRHLDVVARLDGHTGEGVDGLSRDRGGGQDAGGTGATGDFGDSEKGLAGQSVVRLDRPGAAIGHQEFAGLPARLGDAVGIGQRDQPADVSQMGTVLILAPGLAGRLIGKAAREASGVVGARVGSVRSVGAIVAPKSGSC